MVIGVVLRYNKVMQIDEMIDGSDGTPDESVESGDTPVDAGKDAVKKKIGETLDPAERKKGKLAALAAKRESKEISEYDFDLNFLFQLNEAEMPLGRKDMRHESGEQAVVLTKEEFDVLGFIDFIHSSGERMVIGSESLDDGDVFILYPHEVGESAPSPEKQSQKKPEMLPHEIRMQRILFEVFGDAAIDPPAVLHPEWENILARNQRMIFASVAAGRAKGVPDAYVKAFAYDQVSHLASEGKFDMVMRILTNLNFADAEQLAEMQSVIAEAVAAKGK